MTTVEVTVHDAQGKPHAARVATCRCGSQCFSVFQVEGHDHYHLSCVVCELCMCPQHGACSKGKTQHGSHN